MKRPLNLVAFSLVVLIAITDAFCKFFAVLSLPSANDKSLAPLVDLALHKNPGIAFDIPLPFLIIFPLTVIVTGVFCYYLALTWSSNQVAALACSMVIAGALGNLVDRAINGFTTDYLIFFRTSAVNLSDGLILVGMVLFLWYYKAIPRPETKL